MYKMAFVILLFFPNTVEKCWSATCWADGHHVL